MNSTQPLAPPSAVGGLYESLLSSRERARQRLRTVQDIEQRHRDTPLTDLVDLAVTGALRRTASDKDHAQQP